MSIQMTPGLSKDQASNIRGVHTIFTGELTITNPAQDIALADNTNVVVGEFGSPASFPAHGSLRVSLDIGSALPGHIASIIDPGTEFQVVRADAWRVIAYEVADYQAVRNWSNVELPGEAVNLNRLPANVQAAVTSGCFPSGPEPTAVSLLDSRPEAVRRGKSRCFSLVNPAARPPAESRSDVTNNIAESRVLGTALLAGQRDVKARLGRIAAHRKFPLSVSWVGPFAAAPTLQFYHVRPYRKSRWGA